MGLSYFARLNISFIFLKSGKCLGPIYPLGGEEEEDIILMAA